jgi:hypothetical protein
MSELKKTTFYIPKCTRIHRFAYSISKMFLLICAPQLVAFGPSIVYPQLKTWDPPSKRVKKPLHQENQSCFYGTTFNIMLCIKK